jgi:tetratricopeptide (TPR) repeat protein
VALRKGDLQRTELELRLATEAYQAAWATLPRSERRYRTADYLMALESLSELLRASKRFSEATATGERASKIAIGGVDAYDGQRLDTLLSLAKTAREMRESAAVRYLDAVVAARGDTSSDYAWALRTLSYAYLLRGQLDASERMDMQARAIWAKQNIVAPDY